MAEELTTLSKNETEEQDVAIQITGLKKRYRLGLITAGTLRGDLQSWWARVRGKDDPNLKIGAKVHSKNEVFMALDGIDLNIYKGERVGIIGHNGAGKSTLLKLLARVTGPTEGEIKLDGRITSMLEVGTGFNGELTGRENIYLNGAILGMTKAEVDSKMEQIIDFSECRQFIDTPVKRYSSGMFVKLAFSVAAHLDSEIMIMDEVLAVGDVNFQKKCLEKMSEVSKDEGRTILYVSHNMSTIRQLCSRVIVLNHGKVIFDGDVEEGIGVYSEANKLEFSKSVDLTNARRYKYLERDRKITLTRVDFIDSDDGKYTRDDVLKLKVFWESHIEIEKTSLRFTFVTAENGAIASCIIDDCGKTNKGNNCCTVEIPLSNFIPNTYRIGLGLMEPKDDEGFFEYDIVLSS
ncbi:MAG: ABC transporter ATP-binding protein, partial [Clostridia bacterium]|nr:ABC transporter ATP-binding protein [Clostridia bacterium]